MRNRIRALLEDAFFQVMDNTIFRLMVLITIFLVSPTWMLAAKNNQLSVFWGIWTFELENSDRWIQDRQGQFVEWLAGYFGVIFCIAATAFFVPRMLEKGAADVLFSKPISRLSLLLARYFSGILFVAILTTILIGGMHTGLLVFSGYSDPGFLWSILTLTYLFGVVHAFSVCVGVITRSSAAAILLSMVLFVGCSLTHFGWRLKEYFLEVQREEWAASSANMGDDAPIDFDVESEVEPAWRLAHRGLDVLHYVLPKTSDADYITRNLRQVVIHEENPIEDEVGSLVVSKHPDGFEPLFTGPVHDLASETAVWIRTDDAGRETARLELSRYSRRPGDEESNGKRPRNRSPNGEATNLFKDIEKRSDTRDAVKSGDQLEGIYVAFVDWLEDEQGRTVRRKSGFFRIGDWIFRLEATFDDSWDGEAASELVKAQFSAYAPEIDGALRNSPDDWFEKQFGWSAPLKYNAFFSVGTTLAFVLLALGTAWLFLRRIDF